MSTPDSARQAECAAGVGFRRKNGVQAFLEDSDKSSHSKFGCRKHANAYPDAGWVRCVPFSAPRAQAK